MISRFIIPTLVLSIIIATLIGCAKGSNNSILPTVSQSSTTESTATSSHYLWGYFTALVDPSANKIDLVPMRVTANHFNVVKFLEQGPCHNCVSVTSMVNSDHGTKLVDIKITHPFSLKNFTGFNVRGIALFKSGYTFPYSGLSIPDSSVGTGELMNSDGLTALYNSSTVGSGPNGLQGYLKGKFATAVAPDATINGYKRFESADPGNLRHAFYAGDGITVQYDIKMPTASFVLGYAVDGSWAPPTVNPVVDPMTDFPPDANCPEPWKIKVGGYPIGNISQYGGTMKLHVDVEDASGTASHLAPQIEIPDFFSGPMPMSLVSDDGYTSAYEVIIENSYLAGVGLHKLLVSVQDTASSPSWMDITAYRVFDVEVFDASVGWARTFGSTNEEECLATASDGLFNVYVAGYFTSGSGVRTA